MNIKEMIKEEIKDYYIEKEDAYLEFFTAENDICIDEKINDLMRPLKENGEIKDFKTRFFISSKKRGFVHVTWCYQNGWLDDACFKWVFKWKYFPYEE